MASYSTKLILVATACIISTASAIAIDPALVGTWTTKSAKVLTGPGFYNPINDSFIEPSHTGISYSFTADGFYEEAFYRAVSNPTTPTCPQAVMQFQHGTFVQNEDNSLLLTPFAVDGRQLTSNPCQYSTSVYERYNQTESFQKYAVYKDPYYGVTRLDLYQFDGSPMNPMYIAFSPPLMLPTQTMNPTKSSSVASATTGPSKRGIDMEELGLPLNKDAAHIKRDTDSKPVNANWIWWFGIAMTVFGGAAYLL